MDVLYVAKKMRLLVIAAMIATTLQSLGDEGAGKWIMARLDRIVIPKVDCEKATVEEVIDFARIRSIQLDPDAADPSIES